MPAQPDNPQAWSELVQLLDPATTIILHKSQRGLFSVSTAPTNPRHFKHRDKMTGYDLAAVFVAMLAARAARKDHP